MKATLPLQARKTVRLQPSHLNVALLTRGTDVVAETDSSSNESEDDEHLSEEELGDLGIKFASTTTKSKKSKKTSSKKQSKGRQGRELRKRAKVDYKIRNCS